MSEKEYRSEWERKQSRPEINCPDCNTSWRGERAYKAHYVNCHPRPWPWERTTEYEAPFPENARKARKRDGFECQWCQDMSNEEHYQEFSRGLDVHHIKRPEKFDRRRDAHALSNLVTLCRPCHRAIERLQPSQVEQVLQIISA